MASDFVLTSSTISAGRPIPTHHTCDGENISPALSWSGAPEGTQSLALIVDDPDAPRGTFVHWVVFNLPPDQPGSTIPEGVLFDENGVVEGANDAGGVGYSGPCPPAGSSHTYVFRLYALDTRLDLRTGATKKQVTQSMDGHVLAESNLSATYARGSR